MHAQAGHEQIANVFTKFDQIEAMMASAAREAAEQARREVLESLASAPASIPVSEHQAAIRTLSERNRELSQKAAAAQRDRDAIAERDGKLRSRVEVLEERLGAAQRRITELEDVVARVPASGDTEPVEATEAITTAIQPDPQAFAGRKVLLYTGEANGEALGALARSFEPWGAADVTCYWADKDRGPDIVPLDALVVVDVRFMSHPTWEAIQRIAERSGAWWCVTTRAAALIAAEAAGRWKAGRGD